MAKKKLEEHIKDYYNQVNLKDNKVNELKSLIHSNQTGQKSSFIDSFKSIINFEITSRKFSYAFAGLIIIIAINLVFNMLLFNDGEKPLDLSHYVSKEIAMNHIKNLGAEYNFDSFKDISKEMKDLDFSSTEPLFYNEKEFELIGSRYCSIQGNIAAQIKLADINGKVHTLYQTALTEDLKQLQNNSLIVDGVKIRLWEENGLFMGLASPIN